MIWYIVTEKNVNIFMILSIDNWIERSVLIQTMNLFHTFGFNTFHLRLTVSGQRVRCLAKQKNQWLLVVTEIDTQIIESINTYIVDIIWVKIAVHLVQHIVGVVVVCCVVFADQLLVTIADPNGNQICGDLILGWHGLRQIAKQQQ